MDSTIEFIEAHLKEELTVQQLADRVGYSSYHFCRIFSRQQGISPMDYIHKRRLSVARTELTRGRKILDIALEYGYETASGFAKSFRREFGYSPSTYVARMSGMDFQTGLSKIGGDGMNPLFL